MAECILAHISETRFFTKVLAPLNLYQHGKKSAHIINSFLRYSRFWRLKIIPSWDTASFSILRPQWPQPFLTTPTAILSNHLLISMNLHQYTKPHAFSSLCFRDLGNLKIMLSDWSTEFSLLSEEPDLSKVWDLCKNTANIKFLYRWNSDKIND